MFDFLNRFSLPAKYAILAFLGGVLWLIIAWMIDYPLAEPWISLAGVTLGGAIAGYIRQRRGRNR